MNTHEMSGLSVSSQSLLTEFWLPCGPDPSGLFSNDSFQALIDASEVGGKLRHSEEWGISSLIPSAESLWVEET